MMTALKNLLSMAILTISLVVGLTIVSSSAYAQEPPADDDCCKEDTPEPLSPEELTANAEGVAQRLSSLRGQLWSLRAKKADATQVSALEARIVSLEAKGRRGCAGLPTEAGQLKCLEVLQGTTSGTDQKAIDGVITLAQGNRLRKKVVTMADGTDVTEEYDVAPQGQVGGLSPCMDLTRVTGATAEMPSSVLRLRCNSTPPVLSFPDSEVVEDAPMPLWGKILLGAGVGATAGGLIGYGAGAIADPESLDSENFSAGASGKGMYIGIGTGLIFGVVTALIYDAAEN